MKPKFLEPWRLTVCVPHDFKFRPTDLPEEMIDRDEERKTDAVNTIVWSQCPKGVSAGDIVMFTPVRPVDIGLPIATRVVECINALAGVDQPEEALERAREFFEAYCTPGKKPTVEQARKVKVLLGKPKKGSVTNETGSTGEAGVLPHPAEGSRIPAQALGDARAGRQEEACEYP